MIRWEKATPKAVRLVNKIVDRAQKIAKDAGVEINRMNTQMDLTAAAITENIDLEKLAGFDDANLGHDVFGISHHIDRETGMLGGGFWPRCGSTRG